MFSNFSWEQTHVVSIEYCLRYVICLEDIFKVDVVSQSDDHALRENRLFFWEISERIVFRLWFIVFKWPIFSFHVVPSYNQPKFSPCATWDPNATIIANDTLLGTQPIDVFVDINDTIYATSSAINRIQVWSQGSTNPVRTITGGFSLIPVGIFVTRNGDIYSSNSFSYATIDKWALNMTTSTLVMHVNDACYGLFIDTDDYLYCSLGSSNQVIKHSLHSAANISTVVAGTGIVGNASDMLFSPRGIFVDMNFNLYVADCGNHRIQVFSSNQLNAMTVPINGSHGTFTLLCPTEVILDGDGYLFITDGHSNRILGSGPMGFRCIIGCTGVTGPNSLIGPHSLSFDSKGNLFVIGFGDRLLRKFFLSSNSCGKEWPFRISVSYRLNFLHSGNHNLSRWNNYTRTNFHRNNINVYLNVINHSYKSK